MWDKVSNEANAMANRRKKAEEGAMDALEKLKQIRQPSLIEVEKIRIIIDDREEEVVYIMPGSDMIHYLPKDKFESQHFDNEKTDNVWWVKVGSLEKIIALANENEPESKEEECGRWNVL